MSLPLISVILTAYNYAHMLPTALSSALEQDYPNLEILVLDDASTDETPAVVQQFASDPRVRSIRHAQNIGASTNVNYGIEHASGDYLMVLSADNRMMPGLISRLYGTLAEDPRIDIAYGRNIDFRKADNSFSAWDYVPAAYRGGRNEFAGLLSAGCYICHDAVLTRRDIYTTHGLMDLTCYSSDLELLIRWAAAGLTFAYVPEAEFMTVVHPGQRSAPEKFIAGGTVASDMAYFLEKYATAEHAARLRGYERGIMRTMRALETTVYAQGYSDSGELRRRVERIAANLENIRSANSAKQREHGISVVIQADGSADALRLSLTSLVKQDYENWEALVVETGELSMMAACGISDSRIKSLRPYARNTESGALNTAIKIAAHNTLTFMSVAAEFSAGHLACLMELFRGSDYEFCITQENWEAPSGKDSAQFSLTGIALRREALDACGPFEQTTPHADLRELVCRMSRHVPTYARCGTLTAA